MSGASEPPRSSRLRSLLGLSAFPDKDGGRISKEPAEIGAHRFEDPRVRRRGRGMIEADAVHETNIVPQPGARHVMFLWAGQTHLECCRPVRGELTPRAGLRGRPG